MARNSNPNTESAVGSVSGARFLNGVARIPGINVPIAPSGPVPVPPDHVVDIVRGRDLVALRVEVFDLELVRGERPYLRAPADGGRLIVHHAFQHLGEEAVDEADDAARHDIPTGARAAKHSRIAFEVAAGTEIEFSSEGLLDAMRQLPMLVHPQASPRPIRLTLPSGGPGGLGGLIDLGGGLLAAPTPSGLIVGPARRRSAGARAASADTPPATGAQLIRATRQRRRARAQAARFGAQLAHGVEIGELPTAGGAVRIGGVTHRIRGVVEPGGLVGRDPIGRLPRRATTSREPRQFETAIEAPYRLIISPSRYGGWSHATSPVGADGAEHRVELWHSRLGVRQVRDGDATVDERTSFQRIVRAVWTRDRETAAPTSPFLMSLDPADRDDLVVQSAESPLGPAGRPIRPEPVDADALYLSAIGATVDLHGVWDTEPYSAVGLTATLSWDHLAPFGRDQFVQVVRPGYLFPFGHRAVLVKITERKMKDEFPSVAGLFQKRFLLIREPTKQYATNDFPFTEVTIAPLVTPPLTGLPTGEEAFVPDVSGSPFAFVFHCRDKEDVPVRLSAPLVWVPEVGSPFGDIETLYGPFADIDADGQSIAFTESSADVKGDAVAPTLRIVLAGAPAPGEPTGAVRASVPLMDAAEITIDAVEQLAPTGSVRIAFNDRYLQHGFGAANVGEVWATLVDNTGTPKVSELQFGNSEASGTDKAGGFIDPSLEIGGLSRAQGLVNDLDNVANGDFDPGAFLGSALPKLFGLVELTQILEALGIKLDEAPSVVSETLDRIEGLIADLLRAKEMVLDAVAEAEKLVLRAQTKAGELLQDAEDARDAAEALRDDVVIAVDDFIDKLDSITDPDVGDLEVELQAVLDALRGLVPQIRTVAPQLPPLIRSQLLRLGDILDKILTAADLVEDIARFLNGLASGNAELSYRYEWRPRLKSWELGGEVVLELPSDGLTIAVEGRVNGKGELGVEALAELKDFALHLLPGAELVVFRFDHLSFKAGSTGKPEVDVVLQDIEFVGLLGFIEVLKELIPFDGFSDPPFLDVSPQGVTAGFSQDLPNVAIGVFNLSNLSLGADIQVPFLGDVVTVGFEFCRRDRPFTLAVLFIGGGGFFGIRLSPDGLEVLELSLEAGAVLAVDLGVASGSVSAMLGIYMRLEGDAGSLTGYFRLRGEVDVLGLISASIELYLELIYDFPTGKMTGRATLTVKVEVLFFSASVTISAERQFAGSNGDPSFVDVMGLEADGSSAAWSDYCSAFAGA